MGTTIICKCIMTRKSFRFCNFSKALIFCCVVILIMVGVIFWRLTDFKEPKAVKADLTKSGRTSTATAATIITGADQAKFQIAEKSDFTEGSAAEKEDVSLTSHDWEYLRFSMQRNPENITVVKNADGSSAAFLNGTFRTVSAAKLMPDGRLVTRCFESFDALEKFMNSTATESE